jgi:glycosyltransferase involved in cell wall biosynthesis
MSERLENARVKISFVVPAFNEEKLLGNCLHSIGVAVRANARSDFSSEIIVADNNSTDATPSIAKDAGAIVVFEPINQISRARNTGASVATGDWLVFVDADSELSALLLADLLALVDENSCIGCGSLMAMPDLPFWARRMLALWSALSVICNWAAGSFIACRVDAFRTIGGFSTEFFAAEEIDFSRRLKKLAKERKQKFRILRAHPLQTSNRKVVLYSGAEMLRKILPLLRHPAKSLKDKQYLDIWYGGRR